MVYYVCDSSETAANTGDDGPQHNDRTGSSAMLLVECALIRLRF